MTISRNDTRVLTEGITYRYAQHKLFTWRAYHMLHRHTWFIIDDIVTDAPWVKP